MCRPSVIEPIRLYQFPSPPGFYLVQVKKGPEYLTM